MTAEVVVMNTQAIALAADSAVTIGEKQKVFNTANKLFTLSKYHPVGIMLYNNAEIMGVPWETIIGIYRRQLGKQCLRTLLDYANDFVRFLQANNEWLFPPAHQDRILFGYAEDYYLNAVRAVVDAQMNELATQEDAATLERRSEIAEAIIHNQAERWRAIELCDGLDEEFLQALKDQHDEELNVLIGNVFEGYGLSPPSVDELKDAATRIICSKYQLPSDTGLVFAGFGEIELLPQCLAYEVKALLAHRLIYQHNQEGSYSASPTRRGTIMAYAQHDVVATLVGGINPNYRDVIASGLSNLLTNRLPSIITDIVPLPPESDTAGLEAELAGIFGELGAEFLSEAEEHAREEYVSPLVDTIRILPKDDLAALAAALVNITSVKRKVSMEAETVGGPVDVAVISKKDGFIWITRKHYFDPAYNPHFFQNYYHEAQEPGGTDG